MLGGLVAAEGSFVITTKQPSFADGTPRLRFVFSLTMADRDRDLVDALRRFLGYGSIHARPPRRAHWLPSAVFTIASIHAHNIVVIPFAERYLLNTAKRYQFVLWRDALRSYEIMRPSRYRKGRSICSIIGCEKPVRGRMLCRSHYYRATGY